tara:strand:- start:297 stop:1154 length:858 start_codon:yes stop_codon:yes gene_type:complete
MSYLDRIRACNNFDPANYVSFEIDGSRVGWVRRDNARYLAAHGMVFEIAERRVALVRKLETVEERSAALARVVDKLAADGKVPKPRNELYPVTEAFIDPPFALIERSAVPFFGVRASGVHMNGYVRRDDGIHMWVARRARDKITYPGMLDNIVAGGQPHGLDLRENMIKECGEEAGIPEEIAQHVIPVGFIDYAHESEDGAKPDRQYCYDLKLPDDFVPVAADGEVDEFMLWPLEQVAETVRETSEFKFNCNLVILDFLVRHGFLDPDTEPDYTDICRGLHVGKA